MAKMTRLLNVAFRIFQAVPFLRYHIRFDVPVTVGATTLKIPIIEGQYPQYEDYEPWLLAALARIMSNFIATPTSDATALQMLFTLDDAAA
jgi:hypothetical protein